MLFFYSFLFIHFVSKLNTACGLIRRDFRIFSNIIIIIPRCVSFFFSSLPRIILFYLNICILLNFFCILLFMCNFRESELLISSNVVILSIAAIIY